MVTFYAGQRVQAADLAGALPVLGSVTADITVTSSTTLVNATGLAVPLAANAFYAIDCYLAYVAGGTGDIKVALSAPTSSTGHWALMPLVSSATGTSGSLDATRQAGFGDGVTQLGGGSDSFSGAMQCHPVAYVATAGVAGVLQVRFAQGASSATSTLVKTGSWLRATRLA